MQQARIDGGFSSDALLRDQRPLLLLIAPRDFETKELARFQVRVMFQASDE